MSVVTVNSLESVAPEVSSARTPWRALASTPAQSGSWYELLPVPELQPASRSSDVTTVPAVHRPLRSVWVKGLL